MILNILKFCELLLRISPRIINSLRSYIKHSKKCFLPFPNISKLVKKIRLCLVFPTYFSVFGNQRKRSSSCLIYYIETGLSSDCLRQLSQLYPCFSTGGQTLWSILDQKHFLWGGTHLYSFYDRISYPLPPPLSQNRSS